MLPYLAAIGMVTSAGLGAAETTATMAAILRGDGAARARAPGRPAARPHAVEPLLVQINDWMAKNAASTTGWVLGIVGFLVARDAAWDGWACSRRS